MTRRLAIVCALLVGLSCSNHPPAISIDADDPEMNRAIERARTEVPAFVARLEKPQPGDADFAFKAAVKDGERTEHFWLEGVRHETGHLVGTIANDPEFVRTVKLGDQRRVPLKEISDWMFVSHGRLVGGYTTRVLINRLGENERKAMMASLPFKIE